MGKELTKAQENAVNSTGNVLVSAGAGSGKTFVLTQRVIKNIIDPENPISLDEFLILTFTNAAAKEMKTRIKQALNDAGLFDLIYEVDSAHVETFDAYALYVVKKYGYALGLPLNINNVPEDVILVETKKLIDEKLNILFEENNEILSEFIKTYCFKNIHLIDDILLKMTKDLSKYSYENRKKFIEDYEQNFLTDSYIENQKQIVFLYLKDILVDINNLVETIQSEKTKNDFISANYDVNQAKNFDEFIYGLLAISNADISHVEHKFKGDSEIRKEVKKLHDKLLEFNNFNNDYFKNIDIPNLKKFIPFFLNIAFEVSNDLYNFQFNRGYFTFDEIQKLAYRILIEKPEIAEEIKQKTKLIFIDEYQDTSDLQNNFIKLVSNNNVFCVGDIKQSIYLFRGAAPQNFSSLYEEYSSYKGKDKIKQVCTMNDNFRSRPEIVNDTNRIFDKIMHLNFGGADYSNDHNLESGNKDFDSIGKIDSQHGVVKLVYGKEDEPINLIIKDIKKRIALKQKIFDGKIIRPISFKDFAILSTRGTNFLEYENIFKNENIPAKVIYDEQLLKDEVVTVILSCFKFISLSNKHSLNEQESVELKHYFCSIARSFLIEYKDQKIYDLLAKINNEENEKYRTDELFLKLINFANDHKSSLLSTTYNDLINDFNFVEKLSNLYDPISKLEKLEIFNDRVKVMDNLNYDIDDFVNYLELISENNIKMENRHETEASDAVTITTIHKSKGLQYNIVYLMDLNISNNGSETFYGNTEVGYYLPAFSMKNNKSLASYAYKDGIGTKFIEEKMRLFYVGITRAVDTCILVVEPEKKLDTDITKAKTIFDFINCAENLGEFIPINYYSSLDDVEITKENKENTKKTEAISFEYLSFNMEKNKRKTNASKDLKEGTDITKLNYGTHMHLLMELIDFEKKDTSFIKNDFERKKINSVLSLDLFKNIKNNQVYKEYQFIDENNKKDGVIDLLLIFEDHAVVVDYKLKNISDSEYDNQLEVYKNYVEKYFKLPTKCLLLSLLKEETREVF